MKKKNNIIIIAAVAILVVILIIAICLGGKNKTRTVDVSLGETLTVKNGDTLRINDDATLEILTDLTFDTSAEDYEYEVAYNLTVAGEVYEGKTIFYPAYSVRSEAQNVPYSVVISNFTKDSVNVTITQAN